MKDQHDPNHEAHGPKKSRFIFEEYSPMSGVIYRHENQAAMKEQKFFLLGSHASHPTGVKPMKIVLTVCVLLLFFLPPAFAEEKREAATFVGIPQMYREMGMWYMRLVDAKDDEIVVLGDVETMPAATWKCLEDAQTHDQTVSVSGEIVSRQYGLLMDSTGLSCVNEGRKQPRTDPAQTPPVQTAKSPLEVSFDRNSGFGSVPPIKSILLTAVEDNVTVQEIIIDRNACTGLAKYDTSNVYWKVVPTTLKPYTLRFGKMKEHSVGDDCGLREVVIKTNYGTWTYSR